MNNVFVFHYELHVAWATWSCTAVYGYHEWQWGLYGLDTSIDEATDCCLAVFHLQNLLGVGDLVQAQLLSYLWTYLCGITIDSLATTDHDVDIANLLDGGGKGIGCGQCVCTGEEAVGKQPTCICTTVKTLANYLTGTWRTHCKNTNCGTWILLFQSKSLLQCVQIFRIEDGGKGCAVDCAFGCHRILTHISCVWYLLGKYYNF